MAISDDINSIRTHLEEDYTALEALGVSVQDRNIENIKDMAQQIYAKFPKTSYGEGSSVTLENTLKGKLDFEDNKVGYGDTYQYSTNGYNLLSKTDYSTFPTSKNGSGTTITKTSDKITIVTDSTTSSGFYTLASSWGALVDNYSSSNTYTFSCYITASQNTRVLCGFENTAQGTNLTANTKTRFVTTSAGGGTIVCYNVLSLANVTLELTEIQIEEGSTVHTWEPYTNGASPNPSYPQPIEVVTGEQEVVLRGKNLLDISKFQEHYTLNNDGLPVYNGSQTRLTNTTPIDVEGLEKVTLTFSSWTGGSQFIYSLLRADNTKISRVASNISGTTITIGQAKYLYICFYDAATLSNITDAMLVEGDTGATYEPYITPITKQLSLGDLEFAKIGTYRDYIYRTSGKNKFIEYGTGYISNLDGSITANGSVSVTDYIPIPSGASKVYFYGKNLGVSSGNQYANRLAFYDSNKTWVQTGQKSNIGTPTECDIPSGASYLRASIVTAVDDKMISFGGVTDYQPYGSGKWYVKKNINKIILDGTGNWVINQTNTNTIRFGNSSILVNGLAKTIIKVISNMFVVGNTSDNNDYEHIRNANYEYPTYLFVIINKTRLSEETASAFETWLDTNKPIVYYILETPTDTEITDTTLISQLDDIYNMQSVNGTTIIKVSGDLPLILKVRSLKG